MCRLLTILLAVLFVGSQVKAEMPTTRVTPQNIDKLDVSFTIKMTKQTGGDQVRITLTVDPRTEKYSRIGQPGLYLYLGKKRIGQVALYKEGLNNPKTHIYWCDIDKDCLESSSISVVCYPLEPKEKQELCVQSMEYLIDLREQ